MEGVCAGIRLSILPDVHELPWGPAAQQLRTRVATLRRYALLISASPALGSTPRRARLAHPVPFGFHGRYFADLRA